MGLHTSQIEFSASDCRYARIPALESRDREPQWEVRMTMTPNPMRKLKQLLAAVLRLLILKAKAMTFTGES